MLQVSLIYIVRRIRLQNKQSRNTLLSYSCRSLKQNEQTESRQTKTEMNQELDKWRCYQTKSEPNREESLQCERKERSLPKKGKTAHGKLLALRPSLAPHCLHPPATVPELVCAPHLFRCRPYVDHNTIVL